MYLLTELEKRYQSLHEVHSLGTAPGTVLLARSESDARQLRRMFNDGLVQRTWVALIQYRTDANLGRAGPLLEGVQRGRLECRMRRGDPRSRICEGALAYKASLDALPESLCSQRIESMRPAKTLSPSTSS